MALFFTDKKGHQEAKLPVKYKAFFVSVTADGFSGSLSPKRKQFAKMLKERSRIKQRKNPYCN